MATPKITVAGIRTQVQDLLTHANTPLSKRNFLETVELQITLKNYDPQRDKRFCGSVRLPHVARPNMKICLIADQYDLDRARHIGLDAMSVEDVKKLNKNKKLIKKLARKYHAFIISDRLVSSVPRLLGPGLSKVGKFPTPVWPDEDLGEKLVEIKSMVKFVMRKVVCMGVVVGNVGMEQEELTANILLAVNYLVSLLKKGMQNVGGLTIKSTMSPARRIL